MAQMLSERLDAHDAAHSEVRADVGRIDAELANHAARMVENGERFKELLSEQDQRHTNSLQQVRQELVSVTTLATKHESEVAELQSATGVLPGHEKDKNHKTRIVLLEEETDFCNKRSLRLENVLQLEPLTKETANSKAGVTLTHGMLLTDEQIEEFRIAFNRYDEDQSGNVSAEEVGNIMRSVGVEVNKEILE